MPFLKSCLWCFIICFILTNGDDGANKAGVDCTKLLRGQFFCPDPKYEDIDPKTQQLRGCTPKNLALGEIKMLIVLFFIFQFRYQKR